MAKAKEDAYGITGSATDQGVITIGETGWSQALDRVEDSSEIFVSNATDGFGFAPPRDVYDGDFCLYSTRVDHNAAAKQPAYPELLVIVSKSSWERSLTSHIRRIPLGSSIQVRWLGNGLQICSNRDGSGGIVADNRGQTPSGEHTELFFGGVVLRCDCPSHALLRLAVRRSHAAACSHDLQQP